MPPTPDPIVFNVADITRKLAPKIGDLLVVTLPEGFRPQEIEALSEALRGATLETGAVVLVLAPGLDLQKVEQEEMDWLAQEGLALRGYSVPGEEGGRRFRVLHPQKGTLADHPSHLEAIRHARRVLQGGGPLPTPPTTGSAPG